MSTEGDPARSAPWWRLRPPRGGGRKGCDRLLDVATSLSELGVPSLLTVHFDLQSPDHGPWVSVCSVAGSAGSAPDIVVEAFRDAAEMTGMRMATADSVPPVLPRLLCLAAHDEGAIADLRGPPLVQLRGALPVTMTDAMGELALRIVVRSEPVSPGTFLDAVAQHRELLRMWSLARHAATTRGQLSPLLRRSSALLDECAGLSLTVELVGRRAPGWFMERSMERRLTGDLGLAVGWTSGEPQWIPARSDTLRMLMRLGLPC